MKETKTEKSQIQEHTWPKDILVMQSQKKGNLSFNIFLFMLFQSVFLTKCLQLFSLFRFCLFVLCDINTVFVVKNNYEIKKKLGRGDFIV